MSVGTRQLLSYRFPPGAEFQGGLVGALERIEAGGTMRILDALFVARQPESGEVVAVAMTSSSSSGMISKLLTFRLDDAARRKATEAALGGPSGELARSLAEALEPGAATVLVLVEHNWALMLDDAVTRMGGASKRSEFVEAEALVDVRSDLTLPGS